MSTNLMLVLFIKTWCFLHVVRFLYRFKTLLLNSSIWFIDSLGCIKYLDRKIPNHVDYFKLLCPFKINLIRIFIQVDLISKIVMEYLVLKFMV